jgi:hypothetical protein
MVTASMPGVDAIIENAQRLLDDAHLLVDNGRHRTALSLAALSMEESGKACLVRWIVMGWLPHDLRKAVAIGHLDKQRILGTFFYVRSMLEAAKEFYDDPNNLPPELDREPGESAKQFARRTWRHFVDPTNAAFVEFIVGEATERNRQAVFHLEVGTVDWLKKLGFYVDVDAKMQPEPWHKTLAEGDARKMLERAREALRMARAPEMVQKMMCAAYKVGPAINQGTRAKIMAYARSADPASLAQ